MSFIHLNRLAKNTLINALRQCALLPLDPRALGSMISKDVSTVSALVRGADDGARLLLSLCPSAHTDAYIALSEHHDNEVTRPLENELSNTRATKSMSPEDGGKAHVEVDNNVDVDDVLDSLGDVLNTYWRLKTEMAAGSEPEPIRALLKHILPIASGRLIAALSICSNF